MINKIFLIAICLNFFCYSNAQGINKDSLENRFYFSILDILKKHNKNYSEVGNISFIELKLNNNNEFSIAIILTPGIGVGCFDTTRIDNLHHSLLLPYILSIDKSRGSFYIVPCIMQKSTVEKLNTGNTYYTKTIYDLFKNIFFLTTRNRAITILPLAGGTIGPPEF
ncbi:MAG: hypothetical protein BGN92_06735 [Sphingobacteriales bacterium 41-5]|nr:MAG: hypothetical protein ABS67_00060 [Niabella sp. SCN 42-15]OJU28548.1 MAG: hypothetical protein BGN92_06735 [Sphingobacteriales bacterium 41-5]